MDLSLLVFISPLIMDPSLDMIHLMTLTYIIDDVTDLQFN